MTHTFIVTIFSFCGKPHGDLACVLELNLLKPRHNSQRWTHKHVCGLRISHLSRRSWQVVLRMSTTPSVLSCLHRMEVAMKQPVRPIPALRRTKWRKVMEEEGEDEENGWISLLISSDPTNLTDGNCYLGKSGSQRIGKGQMFCFCFSPRKSAKWFLK